MSSSPVGRGDGVRVAADATTRAALRVVVLFGVVSLLADLTYEGARSITGPFLGLLGASGAVVGAVAGFGEFVGYALRLVSGWLADRTGRPWLLLAAGYAVNLLAVPLLALAGRWETAAGLMVAERLGKALRTPSRDAVLARAAARLGTGWGFGLHEAMDQIGALAGPLLVAAVVAASGSLRTAFAALLVPALLALGALGVARVGVGGDGEHPVAGAAHAGRLPRRFWLYLAATALLAAGFADFPLVAFHLVREGVVGAPSVPLLYALAMGVDAGAALAFGRLFDRFGLGVLVGAVLCGALATPLLFLGGSWVVLAGVAVWGVAMGGVESVVRAAVAVLVPATRRGAAYGIFGAVFGLAWFAGSAALGVLLDVSRLLLVVLSVAVQLAAVPVLVRVARPEPGGETA